MAWLLFGSGVLAALVIAACQRQMAAEWEQERGAIMLWDRGYAQAAWRAQNARAQAASERRDPTWLALEEEQMAGLGELRRRVQAGEFGDDTASIEQARMGWARWAVAQGIFGEHPREPERDEEGEHGGQAEAPDEARTA